MDLKNIELLCEFKKYIDEFNECAAEHRALIDRSTKNKQELQLEVSRGKELNDERVLWLNSPTPDMEEVKKLIFEISKNKEIIGFYNDSNERFDEFDSAYNINHVKNLSCIRMKNKELFGLYFSDKYNEIISGCVGLLLDAFALKDYMSRAFDCVNIYGGENPEIKSMVRNEMHQLGLLIISKISDGLLDGSSVFNDEVISEHRKLIGLIDVSAINKEKVGSTFKIKALKDSLKGKDYLSNILGD